jgi:hypothetical protein
MSYQLILLVLLTVIMFGEEALVKLSASPCYFILGPNRRVYPKVSGLAACSENCKWYSFVPLAAVISLFCELV